MVPTPRLPCIACTCYLSALHRRLAGAWCCLLRELEVASPQACLACYLQLKNTSSRYFCPFVDLPFPCHHFPCPHLSAVVDTSTNVKIFLQYVSLSLCPGLSLHNISLPPPPPPDNVEPYMTNPYPFHVAGSPNLMRSHELQVSRLQKWPQQLPAISTILPIMIVTYAQHMIMSAWFGYRAAAAGNSSSITKSAWPGA